VQRRRKGRSPVKIHLLLLGAVLALLAVFVATGPIWP
jgi:hypothetical protein